MTKVSPKETKQIISTYNKIYHFFFNYAVYIIIILISFAIIYFYKFDNNYSISIPKWRSNVIWLIANKDWTQLIWNMSYYIENPFITWIDLDIKIIRWFYLYTWDVIYLKDVFWSYWWYVLPYETYFKTNISVPRYDPSNKYTIPQVDSYIQNFITPNYEFVRVKFPTIIQTNPLNQLIDNSIKKTFLLDCMDWGSLIDSFCEKNLNRLIKYWFQYNLSLDPQWLLSVYNSSKKYWMDAEICQLWLNYFYYNFDIKSTFEPLMKECKWNYEKTFSYLMEYKKIHDEIRTWRFSPDITVYSDLNQFKLVSMMRQIYINSLWNSVNFDLMSRYWEYLKSLLSHDLAVSDYYYQLAFVFNNKYLKYILDSLSKNQSQQIQNTREQMVAMIDKLNRGDDYIWDSFVWLLEKLNSQEYADFIKTNVQNIAIVKEDVNKAFSTYIAQYSFFTPFDVQVDSNKNIIKTVWKIVLNIQIWKEVVKSEINDFQITFKYDSVFKPISIYVPWNQKFTDTINWLLSKNPDVVFDDIYQNLQNIWALKDSSSKDFCTEVSQLLSNKKDISIIWCNSTNVQIKNQSVVYSFNYDSSKLTSYDINNKDIKSKVDNDMKWKTITLEQLPKYISSIVLEIAIPDSNTQPAIPLAVQGTIKDKFSTYLWAQSIDMQLWDKKYVVSFNMKDVRYEVDLFTWENYKINNLKILYSKRSSTQYIIFPIKWLSVNLMESSKLILNKFRDDTVNYLKWLDSEGYEKYLKEVNAK